MQSSNEAKGQIGLVRPHDSLKEVSTTLQRTTLALAFALICVSLTSLPGNTQSLRSASPAFVQPGDELTVRCFTHEQLHVYVSGLVLRDGTIGLPELGVVAVAGRGVQMLRSELRDRYRQVHPGCTVNISIRRPKEGEEGELPETAAAPQPPDAPIKAGDKLRVRCLTEDQVHVDSTVTVAGELTIVLPRIGHVDVAGQRLVDLQQALTTNYRLFYPDCTVEVQGLAEEYNAPITPMAEVVTPTVELTAAERFALLPRFGLDVFAPVETLEMTPPATEPAGGEGEPTVAKTVPPSYLLGPGDELAVRVATDAIEHLNTSVVIDADGRIYLDLIGEVMIAGQRLAQARETLARRYRRFFDRATVSADLARTRVIQVRVTGDARTPGKYLLSGAATLFSALYKAGGPSEVGGLRTIKLIRRGQTPVVLDLYDYLLEGDGAGDVELQPEDTIFIPPAQAMVGIDGHVRRPGRYELSGPTTLAGALQMAAGLAPTGYAHNIQVWRVTGQSQRQVLSVDVEGEGTEGADALLQDGDLVVVQPVLEDPDNVVELSGAVRRPGSYQVFDGMTVSDLVEQAQGLDESAHTEVAALWRLNEELDYEAVNFDLAAAVAGEPPHDLALQARDRVIIYSEEAVEAPMEVEVQGAVLYPSILPWTRGMRVSDMLRLAGGPAEGAYLQRASLMRLGADQRREIMPVALGAARAADTEADLPVERGDILLVLSRSETAPASDIVVAGFVRNPDIYPRLQGMRVSGAILTAGGLAAKAGDEVEFARGGVRGELMPEYLQLVRNGDDFEVTPDPVLSDNDHIAVLGAGDLITKPPWVTIKGQVGRPGAYVLRETAEERDTVWKLIQRAGPLLPDANPNGVVLYRLREAIVKDEQDEDLAQVIQAFNRELRKQVLEEGQQRGAIGDQITRGLSQVFTSEDATAVIVPPRKLSGEVWVRAVPIDGERLVASDGAEGDFPLADGDVLVVPRMPTTVAVLGAVVKQGAVPYVPGQRPHYYLQAAGGTTDDGWIGRLVVIRANGRVQPYAVSTEIKPGDAILVPSRFIFRNIDKPTTLERILSLIGTAVTTYLILN